MNKVYAVEYYDWTGIVSYHLFSTYEKASEWASKQEETPNTWEICEITIDLDE